MFLRAVASSSSAIRHLYDMRPRISTHLRRSISVSASPNLTPDAQVFEDILKLLYVHVHGTQKNLQYWRAIAEGSDTTSGVQFKLHEAIHLIGEGGVLEFERESITKEIPSGILSKIDILMSLRYHLSVCISKVHGELMIFKNSRSSTQNPLARRIANVDAYILELKNPVHSIEEIANLDHFTFDKSVSAETPRDAVNRIYGNLTKMDKNLSLLVATYRRPSKMLPKWMLLTVGAIGVATLSMWIYNQSGPLGIMDNTVAATKDFVIDHIKDPLADLKDELFNKSMKRDMELMEVEEVRLNDECLRRMLLDFIELSTDDKSYTNKSNEEILELIVERYADEIKSPIRGIIRGDLVQEGLIQVHKLKLDLLKEKLSVNKILRAKGLTLAILAASPTIGVPSLGLLIIYKLVNKSERKGRLARRCLLQQIAWRLNELQRKGQHVHKEYWHGLLLYTLDQLYKATESPAKATHEWESVRAEITSLGEMLVDEANLGEKLGEWEKLGNEANGILRRLQENYSCLLPPTHN